MKQHTILVTATTLLLTLTACGTNLISSEESQSDEQSTEQAIVAAVSPDSQATEKVNQLFSLTPTQQSAKQAAVAQCMAAKGFIYQPSTVIENTYDIRSKITPSQLTLDDARVKGYNTEPIESSQSLTENMTPEETEAFMGSETSKSLSVDGIPGMIREDGCVAQSYKDVFGSAEAGIIFESGILNLPLPYLNAVGQDPKMQEVDAAWSQCMKDDFGLDYPNPDHTNLDASSGTIEIATADATCREKVGYEKAIEDLLNAYLTTFLEEEQNLIQKVTEAKKAAETNAPKILNRS